MRYKLVLENTKHNILPIDYSYILNEIIDCHSSNFYENGNYDKEMAKKLFCYSPFLSKYKEINGENNTIKLMSRRLYWIISSPIEEHVTSCARNIFLKKEINVMGVKLKVTGILKMNTPEFNEKEKFLCVSPMCFIKEIINERKNYIFYNYDENFQDTMKQDLINKYNMINDEKIDDVPFNITFDQGYIEKRKGRITKLISIVEKDGFARKVKAVFCPFELETDPRILETGYYAGFSEFNQYGFGLTDIITDTR